mmetsp:Transcript_45535/g.114735  ORF Transcript_45535/g.114735 Transcript_45535/m.114735 type:complete len:215 (+) Transcript_45535:97-741(+)
MHERALGRSNLSGHPRRGWSHRRGHGSGATVGHRCGSGREHAHARHEVLLRDAERAPFLSTVPLVTLAGRWPPRAWLLGPLLLLHRPGLRHHNSHVLHADSVCTAASGEQSGLVEQIGEVRTAPALSAACQGLDVEPLCLEPPGVDLERRGALRAAREPDGDDAVQPPRAHERLVEAVIAVGGCDGHHQGRSIGTTTLTGRVALDTIQLQEKLV